MRERLRLSFNSEIEKSGRFSSLFLSYHGYDLVESKSLLIYFPSCLLA